MYINEILQLDMTSSTIKKIDLFLASCNKKSIDYFKAISYKCLILHKLNKTNDALKILYSYVSDFDKLGDLEIISICDAIIDITLDINKYDQTRKFIDEKKKHLKISNNYLNIKDEIRLSIKKQDYNRAISYLKSYINEILSIEELTWAYENLSQIYLIVHNYKDYLEIATKLEKIYQDNLNTNKLIEINYNKLNISFDEGNYIKVICDANRFINEFDLELEILMKTVILLLNSYILSKDFRKASIIESNYEEYLSKVSNETALAFSNICLSLYTQTNSLIAMKHYQDLVNEYSQIKKKNKSKLKLVKENIIIPKIKDNVLKEEIEEVIKPSIHEVSKDVRNLYVSNNYIKLEKLFKIINNLDSTIKFREIFRTSLIELSKIVHFEEAYLLYYNKGYYGLHYKKERAYDKKLEYENIANTINMMSIEQEQEIYLDINSTEGLKNIVTYENYIEIPYGISIPLFKDDITYASIAFFSDNEFIDEDMSYETLKIISQMLSRDLNIEITQNEIKSSNKKMFFIYDHTSSGIKEVMNGNIHLSNQAKNILGCLEDISENEFKNHIHSSDLASYNKLIEEIYKSLNNNQSIEYRYKKNNEYIEIKETFYPNFDNGILSLYSIIEDNTINKQRSNELYSLAFTNPISKLNSEIKLIMDINNYLVDRKLSLAIVDIMDFKLYEELYGINNANQIIKTVAEELILFFNNNFLVNIYHLGFDRYAIMFVDCNDKRTINNHLFEAFDVISKNINIKSSRVKLYFNCGVYRLSKNTNIDNANKLLDYAYQALSDAKEVNTLEHHISHYDSEVAKIKFNENQLVTHISEAIDHNRLGIIYKQLIDIRKKEIYAYIAQISLDNYDVDKDFMFKVIKRRNLEEIIDKYLISNCSKELKMLNDRYKSYIPIFISLNEKTLNSNIETFIDTQQRFFKTTKHLIFYYEKGDKKELNNLKKLGYKVASSNLIDVYKKQIDYFIYDMSMLDKNSIIEINNLCELNDIIFILNGVTTKEDILLVEELNIKYVYGNYWKKSFRMKKLLEKIS